MNGKTNTIEMEREGDQMNDIMGDVPQGLDRRLCNVSRGAARLKQEMILDMGMGGKSIGYVPTPMASFAVGTYLECLAIE